LDPYIVFLYHGFSFNTSLPTLKIYEIFIQMKKEKKKITHETSTKLMLKFDWNNIGDYSVTRDPIIKSVIFTVRIVEISILP
jgi:hypothetical protein